MLNNPPTERGKVLFLEAFFGYLIGFTEVFSYFPPFLLSSPFPTAFSSLDYFYGELAKY